MGATQTQVDGLVALKKMKPDSQNAETLHNLPKLMDSHFVQNLTDIVTSVSFCFEGWVFNFSVVGKSYGLIISYISKYSDLFLSCFF